MMTRSGPGYVHCVAPTVIPRPVFTAGKGCIRWTAIALVPFSPHVCEVIIFFLAELPKLTLSTSGMRPRG